MADGFSDNGAPLGVPYRGPVVEPQVPVADHTAAKIIASADIAGHFTAGLAAMGQIAAANKRAQLEAEQMASDAALKSRQLDIARENNLLDYRVGLESADASQDYHRDMVDIARQNANSLETYRRDTIKARMNPDNPLSPAGRAKAAALKEADFADFAKEAGPLIDDPNPKNPVDYYAKFQRLQDRWQFSGDKRVKDSLKQIKVRTEQHTVPIKFGRTLNAAKQWEGGSGTKNIPVGQIIEGLKDPDRNEETMRLLESNGLTVKGPIRETGFDVIGPKERSSFITEWLFGKPTQKQTIREETISPRISTYAKMAAGVDFSRGKPRPARVTEPAGDTTATSAPGTKLAQGDVDEAAQTMTDEQAPLPTSDIFPTTETEKELARARAAIKAGKDPAAVRQMLQSKQIDPELLDAETE